MIRNRFPSRRALPEIRKTVEQSQRVIAESASLLRSLLNTEGAVIGRPSVEVSRRNQVPPRLADATFKGAFKAAPHAFLLLTPDLVIAAANPEYLATTMTLEAEIVGCEMFDVFPDNPSVPDADSVSNLRASLLRVIDEARPDRMSRQRYDVRDPDGVFVERWWDPINTPVFDEDGRLALVMHCVSDATENVQAV